MSKKNADTNTNEKAGFFKTNKKIFLTTKLIYVEINVIWFILDMYSICRWISLCLISSLQWAVWKHLLNKNKFINFFSFSKHVFTLQSVVVKIKMFKIQLSHVFTAPSKLQMKKKGLRPLSKFLAFIYVTSSEVFNWRILRK